MKKYKRNKMTNTASWLTLIAFIAFNVAPFPGYAAVTQSIGNDGQVIYTTDSDTVLDVENFDQSAGAKWVFDLGHGNLMVNVNGDRATTWAGKTDIMGGILGVFNRLGFHIASTAEINLQNAGFIGAAMRLTDQSFSKQLKLQGDSDGGYLLNEGKIHGGNVALLGRAVENKGSVEAPLNQVTLAGGQAMTVGLSADNLISVVVDEATASKVKDFAGNDLTDQIKNSGNLTAHKIRLDAKGIKDVFHKAINLSGEVQATDVKFGEDGVVELVAQGDIESTGKLQASKITMDATGAISSMGILHAKELYEKGASFAIGGTFEVGHSHHDNLDHAITFAADTHVSGAVDDIEDIIINAGVTLTLDADTTFTADSDLDYTGAFLMDSTASITSAITIGGQQSYNLTIKASQSSTIGNISNVGILNLQESAGGSNPTFTSDPTQTTWTGITDFRITSGKLNRFTGTGTSNDPYMIYDVYGLQAMAGFLTSNFKLANDITATATSGWNGGDGFDSIGYAATYAPSSTSFYGEYFTGNFNGAGHTISDLFINRSTIECAGLFSGIGYGATISNVGLLNVSITGRDGVGGLVGYADSGGNIVNAYVEGSVVGEYHVGGLVGMNKSHIANSHSTANVTGSADSIGGLVGGNASQIINSFATGNVDGGIDDGGLVGDIYIGSSITNSYATGAVANGSFTGGLVGYVYGGMITNSFATGVASGSSAGGLVGGFGNGGPNIGTNNWWYNATNTQEIGSYGGAGNKANAASDFNDTTHAVYAQGTANAWDFDFDWLDHSLGNALPTLGVNAATNVWIGAGNWSDAGNWSLGVAPTVLSKVLFDFQSTDNAVIDNSFGGSLAKMRVGSQYTGTIFQDRSLSISGLFEQRNGTFAASNPGADTFSAGNFILNGGTFNRYTGAGTTQSPYLVYDVYGLQAITEFLSSSFKLANNIDAATTSNWNFGDGFNPIGNFSGFTGDFNGASHLISDLFINNSALTSGYYLASGLFGVISSGATIRNVGLVNVDITGDIGVGGLAGSNGGSITDSYVTGDVSGGQYVGGLVGTNDGSITNSYTTVNVSGISQEVGGLVGENRGSITNSHAAGTVDGDTRVGGLVGFTFGSSITNSYATADVNGHGPIGGLVGESYGSSSILNSYASGTVHGTGSVGGLVGYIHGSNSSITNSFATGVATSSGDTAGGLIGAHLSGAVTNSWWNFAANAVGIGIDQDVANTNIHSANTASDFYSSSHAVYDNGGINAWDFDFDWLASGSALPTLGMNPDTIIWTGSGNWSNAGNWSLGVVPTALSAVYFNSGSVSDSTIDDSFIGGAIRRLRIASGYTGTITQERSLNISGQFEQSDGTFTASDPANDAFSIGGIFTWDGGVFNRFSGAGTTNSPYMVRDVFDLQAMKQFLSSNFELANNIDAAATNKWNLGAGFNPIGNGSTHFTGDFNGANHTISDLFINRSATEYIGLFGYLDGAEIQNVGLPNINFTGSYGYDYVGGLVGYMNNATITNSYTTGTLSGGGGLGGLVGGELGSTSIDHSHSAVNVAGTGYSIGGLVGLAVGSITNSSATGNVSGYGSVGGLVGTNEGSITNSYAAGIVSGTYAHVGGLAGTNYGNILNSYAAGAVSGNYVVGGLVGDNWGSITNSFATGVATSTWDTAGGLIGSYGSGALTNNWWYNAVNPLNNDIGNVGDAAAENIDEANSINAFYDTAQTVYRHGFADAWDFDFDWIASGSALPTLGVNPNTNVWIGSGDWSNAGNWSLGAAPTGTSAVYFGTNSLNNSAIDDNFGGSIRRLRIGANYTGTITQNRSLSISGKYEQSGGTFSASNPAQDAFSAGDFVLNGGAFNRYTGSGTVQSPYVIYDVYGLQAMKEFLTSSFKLANDIDAASTTNWNGGAGFDPIGSGSSYFAGNFNGDGYTISDLFINRPTADDVGLFGNAGAATIQNIGLLNVDITGQTFVGGLIGNNTQSNISDSYVTGTISGVYDVGGLIGYDVGYFLETIMNTYTSANVSGLDFVGGLIGNEYGSTISNSFSIGTANSLTGTQGALIGLDAGSNGLINNWWYSGFNSYGTGSAGGAPIVGNQANAASDFYSTSHPVYNGTTPWDFTNVWSPRAGNLPALRDVVPPLATPAIVASNPTVVSTVTKANIDALLAKISSSNGSTSSSNIKTNEKMSWLDQMLATLKQAIVDSDKARSNQTAVKPLVDVATYKLDPLKRMFEISVAFADEISKLKNTVPSAPASAGLGTEQKGVNPAAKKDNPENDASPSDDEKKKIEEAASLPVREIITNIMQIITEKATASPIAVKSGVTNFDVDMKDVFKDQSRGIEEFRAMLFNTQSAPLSERGDHLEPVVDTQMMLTKVVGQVKVIAADGRIYNAEANKLLKHGDQVWTATKSQAELKPMTGGETITIKSDAMVNLNQETSKAIQALKAAPAPTDLLTLAFGKMSIEIEHTEKASSFRVQTPTGISGTRD